MNDRIHAIIAATDTREMLSASRLLNLYHLLSQTLHWGVPGDIVEVGCCTGFSAHFIRTVMDSFNSHRPFHVYDSFEGLNQPTPQDAGIASFVFPGMFRTSQVILLDRFQKEGLTPPIIHQGWVEEILPAELPEKVAFAHIDVDLYQPTKHSLEAVYPRASHNAIILVDDYGHPDWPGARRAANDFATTVAEPLCSLNFNPRIEAQYQAYFRKQVKRIRLPAPGQYSESGAASASRPAPRS